MDSLSLPVVTLYKSIVLLLSVASLGWLITGLGLRISRGAALYFAAGNVFLIFGFSIIAARTSEPLYWTYHVPLFLQLVGYGSMRCGMSIMYGGRIPWLDGLLTLAISGMLLLTVPPGTESLPQLNTYFTFAASWTFLRASTELGKQLRRHYALPATVLILVPWVLIAGSFFLRGGLLLGAQLSGDISASAMGNINATAREPLLWATLSLSLLMNSLLLGLAFERLIARVREMSERDGLTGVWNRRAFETRLTAEWERLKRSGNSFSLIMLDLDYFKSVNDTYGHAAGDAALKHTSKVIAKSLRQIDLLGRFGGEEFMVLLPVTGLTGACETAERMRAALAASAMAWEPPIGLSASFGVAVADDPTSTSEALFRRADEALYRAKASGRNRVEAESGKPPPEDAPT